MRIQKDDIPVKVQAEGAVARQKMDFGTVQQAVTMGAECFNLAAGADMAPLLEGLEHDLCHCPHWGYIVSGEVVATFQDGSEETAHTGDLFYWPPWHTVRAAQDSEFVLFSPQHEHGMVMDHVNRKLAG